ncbi:DNA-binding transcriptional regulator, LacI/PurR family [Friedmanniella luteola]|uniref:DNA-binding transcriptional regulator, LacI/PurR family n=1 Tax=Friedmanniella luteola TaxID=546871 RepID=A0A1H1PK68_9ACTN|nr:LacI family DNA-binding transcriptional regulator [Friedmanniella luteola]SDS11554.1 DNA-binding transcriptional regulator, LacI/PurR family [Friedmanniella luteola]
MSPDDPAAGAAGRAPGMLDVARLAGVSHQTVSRVLNDHPSVRPETRARVETAIRELGYRRNSAARALATRRSSTVGLLTATSSRSGPVSTLVAVEQASRAAGLWVSVASLSVYDPASVRSALDHFLDQGVDGIVVIAPVEEAVQVASAVAVDVPMVIVAPRVEAGSRALAVAVDQRQGARLVVRHLAGLGHERIAHVAGPVGWLDAIEREGGWREELDALGLAAPDLVRGDWTAASGYAAVRALDPSATAVFASNDQMALGLVRALVEQGRRVPDDVSVAGFDDIETAAFALPPLTTVRQDFAELGLAAVRTLVGRMAGQPAPPATLVQPALQVRSSTAPPPRRPPGAGAR